MPSTPRRRKLYRQTKRLLIQRFLKWSREVSLWDDNKLKMMPRILDTPELLLANVTLHANLLAKLAELEPVPGDVVPS